jgi:hypothetical protein
MGRELIQNVPSGLEGDFVESQLEKFGHDNAYLGGLIAENYGSFTMGDLKRLEKVFTDIIQYKLVDLPRFVNKYIAQIEEASEDDAALEAKIVVDQLCQTYIDQMDRKLGQRQIAFDVLGIEDDKSIELSFEKQFFNFCELLGEGANGIVLSVDYAQMQVEDPELFAAACDQGLVPQDVLDSGCELGMAVKILKVMDEQALKRECQLQQNAYTILEDHKINVPRVYDQKTLPMGDALRTYLESKLKHSFKGKDLSLFFMDEVVGVDFAHYLLQTYLEYTYPDENFENTSFQVLHQKVSQSLGFSSYKPDPNKRLEPVIHAVNKQKIEMENMGKLMSALHEFGLILRPDFLANFVGAIDRLHEQGFRWGDGHFRNLMVNGELWNDDGDYSCSLIDFGMSNYNPGRPLPTFGKEQDDDNLVQGVKVISDYYLVHGTKLLQNRESLHYFYSLLDENKKAS